MESILLTILTTQTLVTAYNIGTETEVSKRAIVNGHDSPERPFYVQLTVYEASGMKFHCGGSIIGKNTVLTAAHCLKPMPGESDITVVEISYGEMTSLSNAVIFKTNSSSFVYNKGFDWGNDLDIGTGDVAYDVGVVFTTVDFPLRMMIQRCNHSYPAPSTKLGLCGYGQNTTWPHPMHPEKNHPTVLQETYFRQDPNMDTCQPDLICTMSNEPSHYHSASCFGDSGGPLYVLDEDNEPVCQYGIDTWGDDGRIQTCIGGSFSSSVVYYNDWIQQQIDCYEAVTHTHFA